MAKEVQNRIFSENGSTFFEVIKRNGAKVYFAVDAQDIPLLKADTWYAMYCPKRKSHYLESKHKVKFHRYIMNTPDGLVVDHIDRNTYDNRRQNLRNVTVKENTLNIRRPCFQTYAKKGKDGLKYIAKNPNGTWRFRIKNRKSSIDRSFDTKEEAIEYRNEFLKLITGGLE